MNEIDNRIVRFINEHHILSLATTVDDKPYSANCFYVYLKEDNLLVFSSEETKRHSVNALKNAHVSGTIHLDTKSVGKIRGVQFTGLIEQPKDKLLEKAEDAYLKRFPYAALMKNKFWGIKLNYLKFTDNRLGFGKKLIWENS